MGPTPTAEIAAAREARLELAVGGGESPRGVPVHVKLDTGMGRWGVSELPAPPRDVVGLMTHLATADSDLDFARRQLERDSARRPRGYAHLTRHAANSAAALRLPESRFDAARCGIALYGLSPFGTDPAEDGLEPVLSWTSELALAKLLRAGESTGYGRRFVAERDTWIGHRPGRLRRRLPPRPDAAPRCSSTASRGRVVGDGLDGRLRGRARPRAAGGHAGHDRRAAACRSRRTPASPGRSRTSSRRGWQRARRERAGVSSTRTAQLRGAEPGARAGEGPGDERLQPPAGRYQRGTKISRRSRSTARERPLGDERRGRRRAGSRADPKPAALREARASRRSPG